MDLGRRMHQWGAATRAALYIRISVELQAVCMGSRPRLARPCRQPLVCQPTSLNTDRPAHCSVSLYTRRPGAVAADAFFCNVTDALYDRLPEPRQPSSSPSAGSTRYRPSRSLPPGVFSNHKKFTIGEHCYQGCSAARCGAAGRLLQGRTS